MCKTFLKLNIQKHFPYLFWADSFLLLHKSCISDKCLGQFNFTSFTSVYLHFRIFPPMPALNFRSKISKLNLNIIGLRTKVWLISKDWIYRPYWLHVTVVLEMLQCYISNLTLFGMDYYHINRYTYNGKNLHIPIFKIGLMHFVQKKEHKK